MSDEIWKPIPGWEKYAVSNKGRVRGARGWVLKPILGGKRQYYGVRLYKSVTENKLASIHRLVAEAFLENRECKPMVNHIDGNRFNNEASNLEWCTSQENTAHAFNIGTRQSGDGHPRTKLTSRIKRRIRALRAKGAQVKDLAKKFDVHWATIYTALKGPKNA